MQTWIDLLEGQDLLTKQVAEAEANLNAERERLGMYQDQTGAWTNGWYMEESPWANWTTDLDEYGDALDELQAAQAENAAALAEIEGEWAEVAEAAAEAANQARSWDEIVGGAVQALGTELEELCAAYEAARESIDGQIGLFDTMKIESALSVEEMGAAGNPRPRQDDPQPGAALRTVFSRELPL